MESESLGIEGIELAISALWLGKTPEYEGWVSKTEDRLGFPPSLMVRVEVQQSPHFTALSNPRPKPSQTLGPQTLNPETRPSTLSPQTQI